MKVFPYLFTAIATLSTACGGAATQEPPATSDMAAAEAASEPSDEMEAGAESEDSEAASESKAEAAAEAGTPAESSGNVLETASAAGSFNTLVAAVKAAGLEETLSGPGPFTVFAPTDDAFKKLPAGTVESLLKPENKKKLVAILTYHVVAGSMLAKDVVAAKSLKTVQGQQLKVMTEGSDVRVSGAKVVKTDIAASNGVIHVIDSVVLPK